MSTSSGLLAAVTTSGVISIVHDACGVNNRRWTEPGETHFKIISGVTPTIGSSTVCVANNGQ